MAGPVIGVVVSSPFRYSPSFFVINSLTFAQADDEAGKIPDLTVGDRLDTLRDFRWGQASLWGQAFLQRRVFF